MEKGFAKFVSVVFHPLLIPTFFLLILFNSDSYFSLISPAIQKYLLVLVLITTFLLPVSSIPLLLNLGIVKSIQMENPKERIVPYGITFICFVFATYLFTILPFNAPFIIRAFIIASSFAILLTLIISIWWKISAHMVGIGGLAGALIVISFLLMTNLLVFLIPVLILAGIIGAARLQLMAHEPSQIYAGFGLGFLVMMTAFLFV
jgi:hypothetical protein